MAATRFDRALVRRMSSIHGQTRGILKMMHENRHQNDVLIQLLAAKAAISELISPHLDKELRYEILQCLSALSEIKNLSPEIRDLINQIRCLLDCCPTEQIPFLFYYLALIERVVKSNS